jgi:hypothetical protein
MAQPHLDDAAHSTRGAFILELAQDLSQWHDLDIWCALAVWPDSHTRQEATNFADFAKEPPGYHQKSPRA